MATMTLCRAALRRGAVPITLGVSTGLLFTSRQRPIRLDATSRLSSSLSSSSSPPVADTDEWLSPEVVRQLSGGSLAGFLSGVLIGFFSKTLVLLTGVTMVLVQVASRYGVDLLGLLKIRQRVESSRILTALGRNPTFKIAFGTTFALAAFMKF